jgi:hypothetical protein
VIYSKQEKKRQDRAGQDNYKIRLDNYKTRQDKTGQDKTGQDKTRQCKTRQDKIPTKLDPKLTSNTKHAMPPLQKSANVENELGAFIVITIFAI